ncbi:thioredoxin family protein [Temperatibacter marinus]|uniref:Thioredoxin family protein n=1 Tax=Temperatibacter marinus TaxID=1456591 RepID=A0AA52HB62_9PROT|nr:thioredoxin family protein [Temperatibacter marinus]WND03440.1 thioredoxin family protein [Temperatibacter marinus]
MMPYKYLLVFVVGFLSLSACGACSAWAEDKDFELYKESLEPHADVNKALSKALEEKKRLILVIGANWCHDSRSMARKLSTAEMKPLLDEHYIIHYTSVGYYDQALDVSPRFGLPVILGTPTVMIIDPSSHEVVNKSTLHKWRNAYAIDLEETVHYFTEHATASSSVSERPPINKAALARLKLFEEQMAKRVLKGFRHVGPQLKAYKQGKAPESFNEEWNELAKFRSTLAKDLKRLKTQLLQDPEKELILPTYEGFSWNE